MPSKPPPLQPKPYPVPLPYDWRKESDYEYTKRYTRRQWAWEFLRRNYAYQEDWLRIAKQHVTTPVSNGINVIHSPEAAKWGQSYLIHPKVEALRVADLGKHMGFFPVHGNIIRNKGETRNTDSYSITTIEIPRYDVKRMALGIFDVYLPLLPQIKTIRKMLENEQKKIFDKTLKQGDKDQTNYRLYIRHLDALADMSCTMEDVMDELYSNRDSKSTVYRRNERIAEEFRDGGYRRLI